MPIESGKFSDFGDYTIYIQTVNGGEKKDKSLEQVVVIKNLNTVMIKIKKLYLILLNQVISALMKTV